MPEARLPLPFRVAQLVRALPDFPGRDTVLDFLLTREVSYPDAIRGTFGGGLRYQGNPELDRNVLELSLLRFARPALADLFDAVLRPGDVLADVGANVGLYALWGARRVGVTGRVYAFEPVEQTAQTLRSNANVNGFSQLEVHCAAVGAEVGVVRLYRLDRHSARTSRYVNVGSDWTDVRVVTLDGFFECLPAPRLVKIDVEGMEHEVLRGAERLLSGEKPPLIVFEANEAFFRAGGTSYAELLRWLEARDYSVWSMSPGGLRREPRGAAIPGSPNVLAAREGHADHSASLEELRPLRFPAPHCA